MTVAMRLCPLCASGALEESPMQLLRCTRCGMVVCEAIWKHGSNVELNDQAFGEVCPEADSPWIRLFELHNNRRTWSHIRPFIGRGSKLLEIGVGSGSFLQHARNQGLDVSGCDLSAAVCRNVERVLGIPVFNGPLDQMGSGQRFDIIVMNHVLEHVNDPVAFAREARRRLRSGGVLHTAVPNYACWETLLRGSIVYQAYHLSYFTENTLRGVLTKAGLRPMRVWTHESFSGWFLAVSRTLLGVHRSSAGDLVARRTRRMASVLEHAYSLGMAATGAATAPGRLLQAALGRGDELIALAQATAEGRSDI